MDAWVSVGRDIDRVVGKFHSSQLHTSRVCEDLSAELSRLEAELDSNPDAEISTTQRLMLSQTVAKVKDTIQKIATEHRELHSSVSKVGKAIDRNFIADYAGATSEAALSGPDKERLLNQVICQHFFRQGMLDIGEELAKEAGLNMQLDRKEPFLELNQIIEALKHKNLEPALEWARRHREKLQEKASRLEFKLHKLKFLEILNSGAGSQLAAVKYARENFPPFAQQHEKEIQVLMGAMLYPLGSEKSQGPYGWLSDSTLWGEIGELFTKDACALLGLSVNSHLSVVVNAGCRALPALLNIKQVMQQRLVTGVWASREELPIEIDLGKECRYHSLFACPILRQQTSDSNPPMRLTCGHCISRDALHKLSNGNKLKCPYCPMEQNPSDARRIFF
ncbi:unnamed protein product [Darwinula stevensoni]|uniref:Uncharacterized protein n=1 Tax=Darwinula stevensoni TaxID=69355 RepID=A0A7R9FP07_9CRUS|nr:unnamed protein product [Darwinula stevensoni]CAG0897335.1 unnamed protein product [Darwinula stevensoni]